MLSFYSLYFKARMALRTAIIMTPTSAKMAAHMFARPNAVSARQPNLMMSENKIGRAHV